MFSSVSARRCTVWGSKMFEDNIGDAGTTNRRIKRVPAREVLGILLQTIFFLGMYRRCLYGMSKCIFLPRDFLKKYALGGPHTL